MSKMGMVSALFLAGGSPGIRAPGNSLAIDEPARESMARHRRGIRRQTMFDANQGGRTTTFLTVLVASLLPLATARASELDWVRVGKDSKSFVLEPSGKRFVPWGFNYDHDDRGRLIEDYWESDWPAVERHFRQMKG